MHPASEFRQVPVFWSGVPLDGHLTYVLVRAAGSGGPGVVGVAVVGLVLREAGERLCWGGAV